MPDDGARALTGGAIIGAPTWASGEDRVVGRVILRCDYDPIDSTWRQTYKGELVGPGVEAQEFYAGEFDTPEVECPGQWSGNDPGATKFGARVCTDAETTALRHFDLVRSRRAKPFPTVDVECAYDALDVEVGDLLAVTVANVPDIQTGATDLIGAICEVRRKTIDDRTAKVTLSLAQSAAPGNFRLVAPSAIVSGPSSGATLTCYAHEFTDSTGARADVSSFQVGDAVDVWDATLKTNRSGVAYVVSVDPVANQVVLSVGVAGVVAGDVLLLASYAFQPAARRSVSAFAADSASPPLLSGDPAHEFTP
jgi:hypothetical protein